MTTPDIIATIANLSLALSFVVAIIFGISESRFAARRRIELLTLENLRTFQSREFAELLIFVINRKLLTSYDEWKDFPEHDKILLLQFSQMMESLGILVAEKYINLDLVEKTIGSVVTDTWEKLKPWILDSRKKLPDPYLNEYYQWLAQKLSEQMKEKKRKPFYLN